jgi:diguanylate cyclase (GGDEF)-like protein
VLLIDLDHFKSINDRFGHAIGDRVLRMFAEVARKSMRGSDLIGRSGGDGFAAMLLETNREKAVEVAERIKLRADNKGCGRSSGRCDGAAVRAASAAGIGTKSAA